MKALSVKQPWAYLICSGLKDVENRTWPTKFRGRVLIHAPTSKNTQKLTTDQFHEVLCKAGPEMEKHCQKSAIIGSVEIVDCVLNYDSIWAEKTNTTTLGECEKGVTIYNWVLANPVLFANPIPAKGMLSFWEYPMTDEEYLNFEKIGNPCQKE